MKRMLMVYNPHSGSGKAADALPFLVDYFTKDGFEVTVHPTQRPLDGRDVITTRSNRFDVVLVMGGDGLLHEAVNGLAGAGFGSLLYYLPSGTTNDFGNTHLISGDFQEAARQMSEGQAASLDLGLFNGEYFAYVAACGIGTRVSYETSQEDKKRFGPLAYIVRALSTVDLQHWENNCIPLEIEWEKGRAQGDFLFASVSNSRYIAGSDKLVDEGFLWNDGLLEGVFIRRPMNLMDLNAILAGILRKEYPKEYFEQVQSPWFTFRTTEDTPWTLDGEFGGNWKEVHVQAVPQILKIQLPEKDQAYQDDPLSLILRDTLEETLALPAEHDEASDPVEEHPELW